MFRISPAFLMPVDYDLPLEKECSRQKPHEYQFTQVNNQNGYENFGNFFHEKQMLEDDTQSNDNEEEHIAHRDVAKAEIGDAVARIMRIVR